MEVPKISIIVPIFKAEEYLDASISQLRDQDYPNLEIILVNDGSPDRSGIICDKYSAVDSRIFVVHKNNGGASEARNAGLEKATGEYICFADSDDIVCASYVSHLYRDLSSNQSTDLVIQGFIQRWEDREKVFNCFSGKYNLEFGELDRLFFDLCINDYSGPYCKLFRKSILDENNIRFSNEIIYGEDFDFLLRYIPHARVITTTNATNYVYIMHCDSVSSKVYPFDKELSGLRRLDNAYLGIYEFCNSKYLWESRKQTISNYFSRLISSNYTHAYTSKERKYNLSSIDSYLVDLFLGICNEDSVFMKVVAYLLSKRMYCALDAILNIRLNKLSFR